MKHMFVVRKNDIVTPALRDADTGHLGPFIHLFIQAIK